ncbi:hypothetical protein CYMTET_15690 [Cymbomonas tetramitiformis]|uniref:L-ascorbate peroxidase n=1 Tax=Cymbomonas tetramitiformis TaxID=36881 RepID=A0AAE0GDU3_9CHLO|nr:hypothetical protein CYMTET_15690 [Cymbomonas tetramitiformis]
MGVFGSNDGLSMMDKPFLPHHRKVPKDEKWEQDLSDKWIYICIGFALGALGLLAIQYHRPHPFSLSARQGYALPSLDVNVELVKVELEKLYAEKACHPIMLRLAWHDAGTYNKWDLSGGPHASIRFDPEASHGANAGLQIARDLLEPIKKQFPKIGYADLYQLAGVVAVSYAGGPTIPFRLGRQDATGKATCTPDGRLPDANKKQEHLRDIFYRMNMTDEEIVALSGAHTLGKCHADRSGFQGAWTDEPLKFDNSYFKYVLQGQTTADRLLLTTDQVLAEDSDFKQYVEQFANDELLFFQKFQLDLITPAALRLGMRGFLRRDRAPHFTFHLPMSPTTRGLRIYAFSTLGGASTFLRSWHSSTIWLELQLERGRDEQVALVRQVRKDREHQRLAKTIHETIIGGKADGKDDAKLGKVVVYLKTQFENAGFDTSPFDFDDVNKESWTAEPAISYPEMQVRQAHDGRRKAPSVARAISEPQLRAVWQEGQSGAQTIGMRAPYDKKDMTTRRHDEVARILFEALRVSRTGASPVWMAHHAGLDGNNQCSRPMPDFILRRGQCRKDGKDHPGHN